MNDKNGSNTTKQTLVEEGTEFVGKLTSKCPIVVMGSVEGEVTGPVIRVTKSGVVAGNVKVRELRSEGELAGSVESEVVHIAGRVRDGTVIRARTLEVSLTSGEKAMEVVFGECELSVGDEPSKAAAIANATPEVRKPDGKDAKDAKDAKDTKDAKDVKDAKPDAAPSRASEPRIQPPGADAVAVDGAPTAATVASDDNHPRRKRGTIPQPA